MDTDSRIEQLMKFQSDMAGKNYFEVLGVTETADDAAVRSAYNALIKQYGADHFHHVTDKAKCAAIDEVNRMLRSAYDALRREAGRQQYLAQMRSGLTQQEADAHIDIVQVFECEQALSQARSLMDRGEFQVAQQRLEKALSLDGKSPEIKARLAYARYMLMPLEESGGRKRSRVDEVRAELSASAEAMPNADFLRVFLGDVEKLEGDTGKALEWYKAALKLNENNLQAQREIRLLENKAKKEAQADAEPKTLWERIKALLTKKM